jgi:hypothetical protein
MFRLWTKSRLGRKGRDGGGCLRPLGQSLVNQRNRQKQVPRPHIGSQRGRCHSVGRQGSPMVYSVLPNSCGYLFPRPEPLFGAVEMGSNALDLPQACLQHLDRRASALRLLRAGFDAFGETSDDGIELFGH